MPHTNKMVADSVFNNGCTDDTVKSYYQKLEENRQEVRERDRHRRRPVRAIAEYFSVDDRGSTVLTEVRAGFIMWMTMSYIMVVNPVILSTSDPELQKPIMFATAMSASAGSLFIGLVANLPLALMPGMGLNAYFAYGIVKAFNVTWQEAMSCCFASGVILMILAALGVCRKLVQMVLSDHLKKAITVAIGLFQALIGFQVMQLVVADKSTLVTLGDVRPWTNEQLYVSLGGLIMVSVMLVRHVHGALLIGISGTAVAAWLIGMGSPPNGIFGAPRLDAIMTLSFDAWLPGGGHILTMATGTLVLLFVSLFDIAGVQYGLIGMANLLEDGAVPKGNAIFFSAGFGTALGAVLGTSPLIIANESSAGIMEGAKTGLSSVVVAVMFFISAFITPLISAIPSVATGVPLVLIGAFMMAPARGIEWDEMSVAIPAFLTITVVPFTYSIHNGIIAGIIVDMLLSAVPKKSQKDLDLVASATFASPGDTRIWSLRSARTPHSTATTVMEDPLKLEKARRLLEDLTDNDDMLYQDGRGVASQALREALEAYIDAPILS